MRRTVDLHVTINPAPDIHGPLWHFFYDWQTFLAALVGLAIAVIAALIARGQLFAQREQIVLAREQMQAADRASDRERSGEWALIKDDLATLADVASTALERYPAIGPWTDSWKSAVHALGDVAIGSGRFLDEVIGHARTLNFHQRETIKVAREHVEFFVAFYNEVFGEPHDIDPMDERTWPGTIKGLVDSASIALAAFSEARLRTNASVPI